LSANSKHLASFKDWWAKRIDQSSNPSYFGQV
jgi:hypothetical protein